MIPGYTDSGDIDGIGEWTLDVIEGDNAVLDATISVASTAELLAAIAALQALVPAMERAERFVGDR